MITPITATFPALNFPKEVDYPTQEDWAAFSAAAELNYGILSGAWSDKSEEFKEQTNNLAQEIQDIGENAINAITFDNIAQLRLNSNIRRVDILGYYTKGDGGGGTFYWDSTSTEADNGGTIIQATSITTGRWKRVYSGAVNAKWFGAKGDGVTDDTEAFELLEANVTGSEIDLQGKTYKVNQALNTNNYKNGYFSIAGIIHPSEIKPLDLKFKKHCMQFITGNRYDVINPTIFGASDQVFQDFCIVPQPSGNPKLYVTQRSYREDGISSGDNWEKYETYRIIEYDFKEDGSNVTANTFSQPLDIGHGAGLSYTIDDTGQLWFYSGYPNDTVGNTTRSDKGFSRIKWSGSSTSNSDIDYYQMFDYPETANAVNPNYNKGFVKVSEDGSKLVITAANTLTETGDIFIYDLVTVLNSANPKTVKPLSFITDEHYSGYIKQGTAVHGDYLFIYSGVLTDQLNLTVYNLAGSKIASYDFGAFQGLYTKEQLRGSRGVMTASEAEGLFIYANDVYIGQREYWNSISTTVSLSGKYYAVRSDSVGKGPHIPGNSKYWQEVDAQYATNATPWLATTQYNTGSEGWTHVNKRIYKLGTIYENGAVALGYEASVMNRHIKENIGLSNGFRASFSNYVSPVIRHPSLYYENQVYVEYEDDRPTRVVTSGGNNLFKGYGNSIPLIADTTDRVEALMMSSEGINYSSIWNSEGYTVIAARNGNILQLKTFAGDVGSGTSNWAGVMLSGSGESTKYLSPTTTNNVDLGTSSKRFKDVYLTNSPNVSSDERLKQNFRNLRATEKAAAIAIKESICLYKMRDSVEEKGDGARWHVGVKAQQVISILESHGLDPFEYGFVCFDEWCEQEEVKDEEGNITQEYRPAGNKYAIRYEELLCFIISAI